MSLESDLYVLLAPLVEGRVSPDVLPDKPTFPCITYQQIGGRSAWYSEKAMPSHKHARIQLNVWAKTRAQASEIARAAEGLLCDSDLVAEPFGALTALYEELLKLYGTRQDFGVWYPDP